MNKMDRMQRYESLFRRKVANKIIKAQLKRRGFLVLIQRKKVIGSASQFNPPLEAPDLSKAAYDVFGDYSGVSPAKSYPISDIITPEGNIEFTARIVIAKVPNDPFSAASSGMLEKQMIYTMDDITTQDLIIIQSDDGTIKRMVVGQPMLWGLTDAVYKVFEANNLGGSDITL